MKQLILVLVTFIAGIVWASSESLKNGDDSGVKTIKSWIRGQHSVVRVKGQSNDSGALCTDFEIKLEDQLSLQIECGNFSQSRALPLESSSKVSVTRHKGFITITRYGFILKNPQISTTKQTVLKVPFVAEIIHLKISKSGTLAFYQESFKVDEFGRIVQDNYLQAHSLVSKKIKISRNE